VPELRLDHCVIHVSNWERSNAFYTEVLGAELVRAGSRWSYRFGEQQLNPHGPGVEPAAVAKLPVQPGGSDLCFEWPGPIDEAREHLEDHGIPVEAGPVERYGARGGGASLYFRDPDGSLLEFISYTEV
jgi:catechol 2,3-dioxygenase-like lactoylglutathione lyase family enzyme